MLLSKYYCFFSFCNGNRTDSLAKPVCLAVSLPSKGIPSLGAVKGHDNDGAQPGQNLNSTGISHERLTQHKQFREKVKYDGCHLNRLTSIVTLRANVSEYAHSFSSQQLPLELLINFSFGVSFMSVSSSGAHVHTVPFIMRAVGSAL